MGCEVRLCGLGGVYWGRVLGCVVCVVCLSVCVWSVCMCVSGCVGGGLLYTSVSADDKARGELCVAGCVFGMIEVSCVWGVHVFIVLCCVIYLIQLRSCS